MAYTAIPDTDIDTDSPITGALMTLMRDNPIEIAGGAAGAPRIQLAAMDASSVDTTQLVAAAVGRSQIANSTTTSAGSVLTPSNFALNDWALFPMIHVSASVEVDMSGHTGDGGSAANPRFSLHQKSGTPSYDVDHRWIIAA